MRNLAAVLLCSLVLVLLLTGAVFGVLRVQGDGFSARATPSRIEALLATHARDAAMPASVRNLRNPVAVTPQAMQESMAHYANHCAVCHANNGSGDTMLGRGMYPKPPDLRLRTTQQKTDGELFSAIENGIRMSGMPAFGSPDGSTADESWKLVLFLRHLPSLTPAEEQAMQGMNPKTPDEIKEEQQEQQFLHGGDAPSSR